jgi:hypothetical protein
MDILCGRRIALLERRHKEILWRKLPTEVTLRTFPTAIYWLNISGA